MFQFNIVFGILVAYASNALLANLGENAWRWMLTAARSRGGALAVAGGGWVDHQPGLRDLFDHPGLPLAWAVRSLGTALRPYAIAAVALILPFLVSGAAALVWLAAAGRLPVGWADAWWWRMLAIPHQPYLLAALSVVLVAALFRSAALSGPGCLPAESAGPRPS